MTDQNQSVSKYFWC